MNFIADVHLHSHYSRATSKSLDLEHLNYWAQLKGLTVVGTADFTHPRWFAELSEKLEEAEPGLFKLRDEFASDQNELVPKKCRGPVRFLLTVEISSIYKKGDKTRKVHNLVFAPSLAAGARIGSALARIGNIASDGRPILGLDCRDLLEIVLESDPEAFLVPAHIWTPHFAVLGAASGFDSLEECFEDLTPHIFAVETGLSSDPPMNWRLSALDKYTLISNSDAHSPPKLMREANRFDTELSYAGIRRAWETGSSREWLGTIEFFPEEGKYHLDGHRKCQQRMHPKATEKHQGLCPACGKKVTFGVLGRVNSLADRPESFTPAGAAPFLSLVPLPELLGEVFQVGDKSKRVQAEYFRLLEEFGSEYTILMETALEEIERFSHPLLATALEKMRASRIMTEPGYDGQYGVIRTLSKEDRARAENQRELFEISRAEEAQTENEQGQETGNIQGQGEKSLGRADRSTIATGEGAAGPAGSFRLNSQQRAAVEAPLGPQIILAGAGTGKTHTLISRLVHLVEKEGLRPDQLLAVTFTRRAAGEIRDRLVEQLPAFPYAGPVQVGTFHSISAGLLRRWGEAIGLAADFHIAGRSLQLRIVRLLLQAHPEWGISAGELLAEISRWKVRGGIQDSAGPKRSGPWLFPLLPIVVGEYDHELARAGALDFEDLVLRATELFNQPETGDTVRKQFQMVLVDEAQDMNAAQINWLLALTCDGKPFCLVGDPDQSIYSFRGANASIFNEFSKRHPEIPVHLLEENFRCPETVLCAAEQLIAQVPGRLPKRLFSRRKDSPPVQLWKCENSSSEARQVVSAIEEMVEETSMERRDARGAEMPLSGLVRSFNEIAILTRTNGQQAALANGLDKAGIPYQAAQSARKKMEPGAKEMLERMSLSLAPGDDDALERLLVQGVKGFGEKTGADLRQAAADRETSLYQALLDALHSRRWPQAKRKAVQHWLDELHGIPETVGQIGLLKYLQQELEKSGARPGAQRRADADFIQLLATQFQELEPARALEAFLHETSLVLDSDAIDPRAESVKLLTIHAAKGMEFPVVFVCGLEEGLLPVAAQNGESVSIEEERRILYVAMTRARRQLFLTYCRKRFLHGEERESTPSRFLAELPAGNFECQTFGHRLTPRQIADRNQLSLF